MKKLYEAFSITVIVFILNNSLPKTERAMYDARLKSTLSEAGIKAMLKYKPLKERMCTKRYGNNWEARTSFYNCLKRYRKKKQDFNLFIKSPYLYTDANGIVWQKGGGLASVCTPRHGGISFAAYRSISNLTDIYVSAHEVLHMCGAVHQEQDSLEIMYPSPNSFLIRNNGGMSIGNETKTSVNNCLGGFYKK